MMMIGDERPRQNRCAQKYGVISRAMVSLFMCSATPLPGGPVVPAMSAATVMPATAI
jgi:hypothetical protein